MTTATVVIITWNRPAYVRDSLEHLTRLERRPDQVIVVDASPDERTADVVNAFPGVTRIAFPDGAGHMTRSRNAALLSARGDVICFLDDDANVQPQWLTRVLEQFEDPRVGAVAGRTLNGQAGEEQEGRDQIGRVLPHGELTGHFAADPGSVVDVDHGIGANMSFRRSVLGELGGFRDDFPGTALREDTDIFLRVRALGYKAVFVPEALAVHVAAPHVKGRRFDWRYVFWGRHNHALLLARNYGLLSPIFGRWLRHALRAALADHHPQPLRRAFRVLVSVAGIVCGAGRSLLKAGAKPLAPARSDVAGAAVRAALQRRA